MGCGNVKEDDLKDSIKAVSKVNTCSTKNLMMGVEIIKGKSGLSMRPMVTINLFFLSYYLRA